MKLLSIVNAFFTFGTNSCIDLIEVKSRKKQALDSYVNVPGEMIKEYIRRIKAMQNTPNKMSVREIVPTFAADGLGTLILGLLYLGFFARVENGAEIEKVRNIARDNMEMCEEDLRDDNIRKSTVVLGIKDEVPNVELDCDWGPSRIPPCYSELLIAVYSTYIMWFTHEGDIMPDLKKIKPCLLLCVEDYFAQTGKTLHEKLKFADIFNIFKHLFLSGKFMVIIVPNDYLHSLAKERPKHLAHFS